MKTHYLFVSLVAVLTLLSLSITQTVNAGRPIDGDLSWSPDGTTLLSASTDVELYQADLTLVEIGKGDAAEGDYNYVSWSPDGKRFATTGYDYDENKSILAVWSSEDASPLLSTYFPLDQTALYGPIVWMTDSETLLISTWDKANDRRGIFFWDTTTLEVIEKIILDAGDFLSGLTINSSGDQIAFGVATGNRNINTDQYYVRQFDLGTNKLIRELPFPAFPYQIEWAIDEKIAVSSGCGVEIYDSETGDLLHTLFSAQPGCGFFGITDMSWSPDGRYLALAVENNLEIWNIISGELAHEIYGPDAESAELGLGIRALDWHPNGHQLALGWFATNDYWHVQLFVVANLPP